MQLRSSVARYGEALGQRRRFNLKVTVRTIDLGAPPFGVYVMVTVALSLPRFARTVLALAVGISVTTIRPALLMVRRRCAITTGVLRFFFVREARANCAALTVPRI